MTPHLDQTGPQDLIGHPLQRVGALMGRGLELHGRQELRLRRFNLDDGSLWQAFVASVRHLAAEKRLDLSILHGDGTNTVAKKGGMGLGTQGTNTRRVTKSSRSSITMAMS